MPFNQDDDRERAMVAALNLEQPEDRARHDEDGYLILERDGQMHRLSFECKSAAVGKEFGTGRDTGLKQLQRWSRMHFVFGWFEPRDNQIRRMWYGSPAMMKAWNAAEQAYLIPDLILRDCVPDRVSDEVVSMVLGDKDVYTFQELNQLLKDQWKADSRVGRPNLYKERADIRSARSTKDNLYSREVAEIAVRDRIRYLLARGGTVNNRKISPAYVETNCIEILPPRWSANLIKAIEDSWSTEST
ncbi:hypothetical protein ACIBXA_20675 [Micromonospora echinaurantiaca]|uniref:hypothetical protein n=1 Tax=Micromonospora echinaurantiaca TaxID=47857 RepID=UPI0037916F72